MYFLQLGNNIAKFHLNPNFTIVYHCMYIDNNTADTAQS